MRRRVRSSTFFVVLLLGMLSSTGAFATPPSTAFRFFHDADGRLKAAIDPEGDTAVYNWDAAGNLLSITRHSSSKLAIVQLSPARGQVGATVRIEGTGFSTTASSNVVKFNGTTASVSAATASSLTVKVPSGATSGPVSISTPEEGPVMSAGSFTVLESLAPNISSISPSLAASGEEVTISGSNFESSIAANNLVLNQVRPEVTAASSGALKFKVPPGTLGGPVSVSTPEGSSAGPDLFIPPNGLATSKVGWTGRLSLGGSKTVGFAGSEKASLLLFEGVAGRRVLMSFSESTITSGTVSVWSPSGVQVASTTFSQSSGGYLEETVPLPMSGTYTVLLTPSGSAAGSVKVTSYDFPGVLGSITPAATAEGTTQHVETSFPGQVAHYAVTISAGERIALKTNNSNFTGQYSIKWLKPTGEEHSSMGFGAKENYFWDTQTFATAGTYTLIVDPGGSATGSVDLQLWEAPDKTGQTITPSAEGGSVTSTISVPGQRELITFSGTKEETISWKTNQSSIPFGGTLYLQRPNGATVTNGSFPANFRIPVITLPETGTYTFIVDPAATGSSAATGGLGSLTLTAYKPIGNPLTPAATAEGTTQHVETSFPGQVAHYAVTISAGERIALKTNNSNFTGQYSIKWLKPTGEEHSSMGFGAKENYFWDTQTFATAGTYTLIVDPGGSATGSVDLQLWEAPDKTGQTITPSAEGASVTSTISVPGQRELITFSGTASQLVTIKATESTIANGSMWVMKPDGTLFWGSEFGFSSSGKKELTLPSTGTYKLVVDPPASGTSAPSTGIGSVKATIYLGSHVALLGPMGPTAQLVSLRTRVPLGPPDGYSDISGRSGSTSAAHAATSLFTRASSSVQPRRSASSADRTGDKRQQHEGSPIGSRGITSQMRAFHPAPLKVWHPPRNVPGWEATEPDTPWAELKALRAPAGTTALAGQALERNGLPVAGARVAIEGLGTDARTDEAGRFLLSGIPAGEQTLLIDGESVPGERSYGSYEVNVDLANQKTIVLDYTIWLSPLDPAGDQRVASPTKHETRLRTSSIPGLEVRIPAGTVIKSAAGKTVRDLNITAIPVNQAPFPLPPFVPIPVYFTIQPGRAYLSKGAQIVYPNWAHLRPGQRAEFWNYDPEDQGWYVYGRGTVTKDGKQVVPDPGVRIWEFTGAMLAGSPMPPGSAPTGEASSGDPVDLYSGLFTYHQQDLVLPDTIPIQIQRTYRPADTNSYSFGIGTTNQYDLRLWSGAGAAEANLILPDGKKITYVRTTPGTGYSDAAYKSTSAPGPFYGSILKYSPSSGGAYWNLQLTNGMTYVFGVGRLLEVRDGRGSQLVITRSGENISKITSPNGRWVKFTYDSSSRITELLDNGGRKVKYTYTSGRLTKVEGLGGRTTEYEYDGSGRMKAVINARGKKYLQIAYDANGRVEKQTAGDGATFSFAYDLNGSGQVQATTVTDPLGSQKKVTFNSEGRPTGEIFEPESELEQARTFEVQANTGLRLAETDPLGHITEFEYDNNGNVTEVTLLAGTEDAQTTKFAYQPGTSWLTEVADPLGHATKYEYGSKGELLKRTDPLGHATTVKYNAAGQVSAITNAVNETTDFGYSRGDLTSITDPLGRTTSRYVDGVGRVLAVTAPGGERTRYAYNEPGQLTSFTSPSGAITGLEYDADGNPIKITDPRGKETTMTYDVMDRLETETDPLGNTAEWGYDKAGNLIEEISGSGKVATFAYDPLRRLETASFGVSGLTAESTIDYAYDDANRLTHVDDSASGEYVVDRDPLGRIESLEGPGGTVSYAYDAAGRRESMSATGLEPVTYSYDNADRLTGLSRGSESVGLEYDKANRPTAVTLPNGIEQEYGYDAAGQTTSITYKDEAATLGTIEYAYDANGRQEAMWGSYARLNLPQALNAGEYNADNQLVKRGSVEYGYDKDGNLISDEANEYSWNARGELTGISGETSASFGYDPFGRRIEKTIGATTIDSLYDGANVALESEEGTPSGATLYGLRADQLFARATASGTDSYLTDRLGSTIALADATGEVATSYTYEPFGAATSTGAASDNPFQFTGRENDGTGLQYNRARYYSFEAGRFISQDPAGFAGSGTNFYGYVFGDPADHIDPSGEVGIGMPVTIPIPDPTAVVEDLGEGALNNLEESARQVGDWVSGGPGVSSETQEETNPFESDPVLDVLCEKTYQEWGVEYTGPACEETGDSTDPEKPPVLVPGADPQHPVPVEPSRVIVRPPWIPRPTPFPIP